MKIEEKDPGESDLLDNITNLSVYKMRILVFQLIADFCNVAMLLHHTMLCRFRLIKTS